MILINLTTGPIFLIKATVDRLKADYKMLEFFRRLNAGYDTLSESSLYCFGIFQFNLIDLNFKLTDKVRVFFAKQFYFQQATVLYV